jgi:LysM repeat protein
MIRLSPILRSAALILLTGMLTGCPSSQGNLDEQKDPHFLNGRARVTSLDYKGAIEEFEKALETNPHSSAAHLELALLNEEQMKDYAAAIYHYERHLKLRPDSEYTERARDRIKSCKMDLVKSEVLGPVNQGMQRDLERLTTENMLLKQRVETLEAQLSGQSPVTNPVLPSNPATSIRNPGSSPIDPSETALKNTPPAPRVQPREPLPSPIKTRKHTVKSGDKLTGIAKEYSVDLNKLLRANPGVDPTRLKIGQTLNIP